jgi:hypothetical protein
MWSALAQLTPALDETHGQLQESRLLLLLSSPARERGGVA